MGSNHRPAEGVLDASSFTSWRARGPIRAPGTWSCYMCPICNRLHSIKPLSSGVTIFIVGRMLFINFICKFLFSCSSCSLGCLSHLMFLALYGPHIPHNSAVSSCILDKQSAFGCDHFYTVI